MRRAWAPVISRRVLLNLKTGTAIAGVLVGERNGLLELRGAELLEAGKKTPLDGSVYVERANVDFGQALPAEV